MYANLYDDKDLDRSYRRGDSYAQGGVSENSIHLSDDVEDSNGKTYRAWIDPSAHNELCFINSSSNLEAIRLYRIGHTSTEYNIKLIW